jgi:hypothetical protein
VRIIPVGGEPCSGNGSVSDNSGVHRRKRKGCLFFHQGGLSDLPQTYLLIAILSAPAAEAALLLMHLFGSRGGRVAGLLLLAALQTFWYRTVPGDGTTLTLFFVLIPLLYGVVLSMTWLLGADLLDSAPRFVLARLYSTMGAASMGGGLVGAAFGRTARRVDPSSFCWLALRC